MTTFSATRLINFFKGIQDSKFALYKGLSNDHLYLDMLKAWLEINTKIEQQRSMVPKRLLMGMKEEREKAGLKLNILKTKIMASSPITSQHVDGVKLETEADFSFLGSKITVDANCSHEIKSLLLGQEATTNQDSSLKSRDITFPQRSV